MLGWLKRRGEVKIGQKMKGTEGKKTGRTWREIEGEGGRTIRHVHTTVFGVI